MDGAEAVLDKARQDYERAEYRWVAQVASQLVFADPANSDAHDLAADALEQLGYQAESATARNACLQGAFELRNSLVVPQDLIRAQRKRGSWRGRLVSGR